MTGGPATSEADGGTAPEVLALAKVVARLRAEVADLEGVASVAAVVERAKGVVMAQTGVSAEAAHQLLVDRAGQRRRTLLEECWITLGRTGPGPPALPPEADPPEPDGAPPEGHLSPFSTSRYAVGDGGPSVRSVLAALAHGLAAARTGDDVAELLVAGLGEAADVTAVMIYAVAAGGSLELTGRAGVDDALAEQWGRVPPLTGLAALEALAAEEPVWLEDAERDAALHVLIGDVPGRWPSRAWLPVPGRRPPTTVVGFFRSRPGRFDARTRTLLRRAVRLCGGRLGEERAPGRADPPAADTAAVQAVFDALPGPAVLLSPLYAANGEVADFRIDAAAPESVDVAGRRGRELVGRRVLETYPTVAGTDLWHGYLSTLITDTVYEGEPFTYEEVSAGVPRTSVYSVRASKLGERLVVSWMRHDSSEREARRLAELQRLGNLGWAGWDLATDTITWSDQVYTVFDRDPALGPMTLEELPRHLVPDDLPRLGAAVERLLGEGEPVDEPFRITTEQGGVRHLRIVAEAQRDADGTPVEVHGFFQDVSAQRAAEIALVESARANLVQRGMLQAERALGARLQETLLPISEQSLELAGLCVDVAYVPADSGLNVGGDWYSAIGLPDGGALFVVGDVAGHGLAAVGTMAQLRFTAKGMAVTGSPLPDVLRRLNTLLLHTASDPEGATATMVMAHYAPEGRKLTWVRAGHLAPLLVRDGEARYLPQPRGCLLGAAFEAAYGQSVLELRPGDHLLFYTDGLVEDPDEDIDRGMARFARTALELLRTGPSEALARSLAGLRPGNRDDMCVLHVNLPDGDDG